MVIHNYDCEVYTLADVLNDMIRFEEKLETIASHETAREFQLLVDDLIAAVADVNAAVGDLSEEARTQMWEAERLQDELHCANETIDDLRDTFRRIKNTVDQEAG